MTGMFEFLDAQGGWLEFAYRKYPGEPIQMIKLFHGEICDFPMGIVKHLNNTKKKIRRYSQEIAQEGKRPTQLYETFKSEIHTHGCSVSAPYNSNYPSILFPICNI